MSMPLPHQARGTGPQVLLVHGTAADFFDQLDQALRIDHRVVRVSRRGFPGSGCDPVHTLPPHTDDLAQILQGGGAPGTVVGWSVGGIIALKLALRHPELVNALVLIEPPWLAKSHPSLALVRAVLGGKLRGAFGNPEAGGERFLRWALGIRTGGSELDSLSMEQRSLIRHAGPAIVAELDGGTGEHLARVLTRPLPIPVRLLCGERSPREFEAAAHRLASLLQIKPEVVAGAGHLLQETHADKVATVVRELTART
ncbi:MAG TPA: alpha/beta hydrolase [Polyangiaceae bacterium]|nr:alpha/beta hydrolase [Polyangiaceae bacterium]